MNDFTCKAITVEQPSATFYVASVKASELRAICRPLTQRPESGIFSRETTAPVPLSEKQLGALVRSLQTAEYRAAGTDVVDQEMGVPYQRLLNERRARDIAHYIDQPSALLPNSIIVAINTSIEEEAVIKPLGDKLVRISLPRSPESAVILDGQHRVAAFDYVRPEVAASMEVVVAFLIGIPFYQQAELFAVINGKQKPVNRSIIYDLFGYVTPSAAKDDKLYEGLMAVARFCSHTARILNQIEQSPWKGKVKMRGPGDEGAISQAAVVDYLSALVEPKKYTLRLKVLPLLYTYFKDADSVSCASVLIVYLAAIRAAWKDEWANGQTLFWKNNGVAVMFRILHDMILLAGGPTELMDQYSRIVERWKRAPAENILTPPKAGGGGIQNQLYELFRTKVFDVEESAKLEVKRNELKRLLLANGGLVE